MSRHVPSATAITAGAMPRYWMWTIRRCTACHQNLPGHRDEGAGSIIVASKDRKGEAVSQFDKDHHPDLSDSWKSRSADPKRIKFNHALHLAAGLTLQKDGAKFNFGRLSPADRVRYGGADEKQTGEPIKLECAFMSSARSRRTHTERLHRVADTGPPLPSGLYMAPIVYENHCAALPLASVRRKTPRAVRPPRYLGPGDAERSQAALHERGGQGRPQSCFGRSFRHGQCPAGLCGKQSRLSRRQSTRRCFLPQSSSSARRWKTTLDVNRSCPREDEAVSSATTWRPGPAQSSTRALLRSSRSSGRS